MMNRQIEEALHSAKVFVLHAVDEVTFKARRLFEKDTLTDASERSGFQSKEEVPIEGAPDEEVEVWLDESDFTGSQGEQKGPPSEIGPTVDEELFMAAAGESDEDPFNDEVDLPRVRPSRDSLGEEMARAMLINASGGSSDDEPVDEVDPLDRIAIASER